MRCLLVVLGIIGLSLAQPRAAHAQSPACCSIVRIDSVRSLVTARELATGFTFRFEVKARQQLAALKINQSVWADFVDKTVKLKATDRSPCCDIVPVETP